MLATDFRRLSAAYNSGLLRAAQQALGEQARRINDEELVMATANVEKNMDAFRNACDSALAANANVTPASRKTAIHAMKNSARALNAALGKKQKGVAAWQRFARSLQKSGWRMRAPPRVDKETAGLNRRYATDDTAAAVGVAAGWGQPRTRK